MKTCLYIGLTTNENNKIEKARALNVINKALIKNNIFGFTCLNAVGFWKGQQERSIKVEILGSINQNQLDKTIKGLKCELKQDCILKTIEQTRTEFL